MIRLEPEVAPVRPPGRERPGPRTEAVGSGGRECGEPTSPQAGHVILDLKGLKSLDGQRLAALLGYRRQVRASGGEVCLVSLPPRVRLQALKMQLHRLFNIFNTPEEALRGTSR